MIGIGISIWQPGGSGGGSSAPAILNEDGGYLLLETGDRMLLE